MVHFCMFRADRSQRRYEEEATMKKRGVDDDDAGDSVLRPMMPLPLTPPPTLLQKRPGSPVAAPTATPVSSPAAAADVDTRW